MYGARSGGLLISFRNRGNRRDGTDRFLGCGKGGEGGGERGGRVRGLEGRLVGENTK